MDSSDTTTTDLGQATGGTSKSSSDAGRHPGNSAKGSNPAETPGAAERFHLKTWLEGRNARQRPMRNPSADDQSLALAALDQPHPEDFGVLAYAYVSAGSTATALRALTTHPFYRALDVQVAAEPIAAPVTPYPKGRAAERVRITMPTPTVRFEVPPRTLVEEALASIIGLGRWRVEVRRDERFVVGELSVPSVRGDSLSSEQLLKLAAQLGDGRYREGPQASVLCGWEPLEQGQAAGPPLRAQLSGQRLSSLLGVRSRALYERARANSQLADRLLVVMAETCGLIYKAATAAEALKTSERTMRRRLAAEDTSFQQVLDEFRAALAMDYLAVTALPTQLIGELLGFTEATNFRRAFIRWAGQSPHQFRRTTQG